MLFGEERGDDMDLSSALKSLALPAEETARSVFLAWEKLRVAFNAVLVVIVLLSAGSALAESRFWLLLAQGALSANLCFCLGPVAEGYLTLLGLNRQNARSMVFSFGLVVGCLLAFLAVFAWNMRSID